MVKIQNVLDFVATLAYLKKMLKHSPEAKKEAGRLIHILQKKCSHAKAEKRDKICPDCLKTLTSQHKKQDHLKGK
jgi:hypothetical protein